MFSNIKTIPQSLSYNEEDVSDKPRYVQNFRKIPANNPRKLAQFRNRLRSLLSVEDLITSVTTSLDQKGVLENTYFVFVSDNGWSYGQHRITNAKLTPYLEANVVPAWIWGPGIPVNVTRNYLVANSDLAQTFAEWAGAQVPSFVSGRSLVPLLKSTSLPIDEWRQAIGLSYQEDLYHPFPDSSNPWPPSYFGLLTNKDKYVHYNTLEEELYLYDLDPYEMDSQHTNPLYANKMKMMSRWARALGHCYGETCRQLDKKPPSN